MNRLIVLSLGVTGKDSRSYIKYKYDQFHPFTSIHPCFPSKKSKPGTNLART